MKYTFKMKLLHDYIRNSYFFLRNFYDANILEWLYVFVKTGLKVDETELKLIILKFCYLCKLPATSVPPIFRYVFDYGVQKLKWEKLIRIKGDFCLTKFYQKQFWD